MEEQTPCIKAHGSRSQHLATGSWLTAMCAHAPALTQPPAGHPKNAHSGSGTSSAQPRRLGQVAAGQGAGRAVLARPRPGRRCPLTVLASGRAPRGLVLKALTPPGPRPYPAWRLHTRISGARPRQCEGLGGGLGRGLVSSHASASSQAVAEFGKTFAAPGETSLLVTDFVSFI